MLPTLHREKNDDQEHTKNLEVWTNFALDLMQAKRKELEKDEKILTNKIITKRVPVAVKKLAYYTVLTELGLPDYQIQNILKNYLARLCDRYVLGEEGDIFYAEEVKRTGCGADRIWQCLNDNVDLQQDPVLRELVSYFASHLSILLTTLYIVGLQNVRSGYITFADANKGTELYESYFLMLEILEQVKKGESRETCVLWRISDKSPNIISLTTDGGVHARAIPSETAFRFKNDKPVNFPYSNQLSVSHENKKRIVCTPPMLGWGTRDLLPEKNSFFLNMRHYNIDFTDLKKKIDPKIYEIYIKTYMMLLLLRHSKDQNNLLSLLSIELIHSIAKRINPLFSNPLFHVRRQKFFANVAKNKERKSQSSNSESENNNKKDNDNINNRKCPG